MARQLTTGLAQQSLKRIMQGAVLYGPRDVRFEEREVPTISLVGADLCTVNSSSL
jgi:hypothetical protein